MKIKAIELIRPINLDYIFGITGNYTVSKLDNHIFDMSETNKGYMVLYKGQKAFIPESNVAAVLFEEEKTGNMRAILVNFLYLIGAAVMFYPAISGKVYLSAICIPVGITICVFSLALPQSKSSEFNHDILDSHLVDNHKFQIWNSDKKVEDFSKIIEGFNQ